MTKYPEDLTLKRARRRYHEARVELADLNKKIQRGEATAADIRRQRKVQKKVWQWRKRI